MSLLGLSRGSTSSTMSSESLSNTPTEDSESRRAKLISSRKSRLAKITGQKEPENKSKKNVSPIKPREEPVSVLRERVQAEEPVAVVEETQKTHPILRQVLPAKPLLPTLFTVWVALLVTIWLGSHIRNPTCWAQLIFAEGPSFGHCPQLPSNYVKTVAIGGAFVGVSLLIHCLLISRMSALRMTANLFRLFCLYLVLLIVFARAYASYGHLVPMSFWDRYHGLATWVQTVRYGKDAAKSCGCGGGDGSSFNAGSGHAHIDYAEDDEL